MKRLRNVLITDFNKDNFNELMQWLEDNTDVAWSSGNKPTRSSGYNRNMTFIKIYQDGFLYKSDYKEDNLYKSITFKEYTYKQFKEEFMEDIKVGDRVRAIEDEDGKSITGLEGVVLSEYNHKRGDYLAIHFDKWIDGHDYCDGIATYGYGWNVSKSKLVKVSESNKIKKGDFVKVLRKWDDSEEGCLSTYMSEMDDIIGEVGKVVDINANDDDILVSFSNMLTYWYPRHVLQKINNKTEQTMSNEVSADKQGIINRYEKGCETVRETLEDMFPETIREYKEKKKKSWYIDSYNNRIVAKDVKDDREVAVLVKFSSDSLYSITDAEDALKRYGYDPHEHGHEFNRYGGIILESKHF